MSESLRRFSNGRWEVCYDDGTTWLPEALVVDPGQYVRDYYGVPARVGVRIKFEDRVGPIVGFQDHYLRVDLGDAEPAILHPTWHVEYVTETPVVLPVAVERGQG